jgi:ribonucleotide reductase alpha subunit
MSSEPKRRGISDNALNILQQRYLEPDETVDMLFKRVSGGNEAFEKIMRDLDFLPNSPALMNKGLKKKGTSSACFVFNISDTLLDDDNGIMATARKAAAVAKWGGGVGYYLGDLRPTRAPIQSTHRVACGPIGVLRFNNEIARLITQGGRRSLAQMAVLPSWHPDIHQFIHVKDLDPQSLRTFNISVSVTDAFMARAEVEGTSENQLWNEIVDSAWKTGDPGLFFHDAFNRANPSPHVGPILACNPCLTANTEVYVADGRTKVTIGKLAKQGKDVPVFCLDENDEICVRMMRNPRQTGTRQIYKVTIAGGKTIRVTGNHKFQLKSGLYADILSLRVGDVLSVTTRYEVQTIKSDHTDAKSAYVGIENNRQAATEHRLVAEFKAGRKLREHDTVQHKDENPYNNDPTNLEIICPRDCPEENVWERTANATMIKHGVELTKQLGKRMSEEAWSAFAITNGLPKTISHFREKSLGNFRAFANRCLILAGLGDLLAPPDLLDEFTQLTEDGLEARVNFNSLNVCKRCEACDGKFWVPAAAREIGACCAPCARRLERHQDQKKVRSDRYDNTHEDLSYKRRKLYHAQKEEQGRSPALVEWQQYTRTHTHSSFARIADVDPWLWSEFVESTIYGDYTVIKIEEDGVEDVYNGTVDDVHNFFVGGWEEPPTEGIRSKTLWLNNLQCGEQGLRNNEACLLGSINLNYFVTKNRTVDWNRLEEVTETATRFLDHVVDTNNFPDPAITAAVNLTRKMGLGAMGWADMLALMHIHYDTVEAVNLAEQVMQFVNEVASDTSVVLAQEAGAPYPASQGDLHRNEMRTCIAPTGTIAIIAGCSGACEPHFALEWDRIMNAGAETRKEEVLKERIAVWDELDGFVPKTAMEIGWEWHVRHQAAFQRHLDNGCSKTINLANSATREDVSKAYRMAWKSGCKGSTVFRDGCRSGGEQVLKAVSKTPETKPVSETPIVVTTKSCRRRPPKERKSITHRITINDFDGYVHAGMYEDGSLCEIFLTTGKEGSTVSGLLDSWAIAVSHAVQHGDPLPDLVKKYSGTRFEPSGFTGDPEIPSCTSIVDYIFRWLDKRFGKGKDDPEHKGEAVGSGMFCPDCGSEAIYQAGCLTCKNQCGFSRCG